MKANIQVGDNLEWFEVKDNPNWWDKEYLFCMLMGAWKKYTFNPSDAENEDYRLLTSLDNLAMNIFRGKKFKLISDYFDFIGTFINYERGYTLNIDDGKNKYTLDGDFESKYNFCVTYIYQQICGLKQKVLFGIGKNTPLWVDVPDIFITINPKSDWKVTWQMPLRYGIPIITFLPFFTGAYPDYYYDRLLIPAKNKWLNNKTFTFEKINQFEWDIAEHLGFGSNVYEDEYIQILSDAFLNQKYILIENRPVLVRLEEHPLVKEIILVKKGDFLIAKICTFQYGEILHKQSLTLIERLDFLKLFKFEAGTEWIGDENWAVNALVASIYRDLVTVEEKEIGTRRVAGKKKPDLKTRKIDPFEPKLFTTSWQYIPRRQYIYNRPDDSSYMDREPLSEADQHKQRAIRKWHMVCGHIRRYRDKADWMASGEKQDQALADGVILRQGETYVRPHARNAGALEELGEIDINSIPHYMRRKIAS